MSRVFRLDLSDDTPRDSPPQVDLVMQHGCGLVVRGELDLRSVEQLRTAAYAAYRADPGATDSATFVLDLAGVTFMDSSAVHALTEIQRELAARAWTVELLVPEAAGPRRVIRLAAEVGWMTC
jgi:anti-anti-sigma factor